jgi:predicted nucleic acid-binding protein
MSVTVVDASAVAAVLFDEPESAPVLASVAGRLLAPTLLPYELASICAAKIAKRPAETQLILARYRLFGDLDLHMRDPEWASLPQLANQWLLPVYDAAYLQLALASGAPLVTLDARLAAAYDKASEKR